MHEVDGASSDGKRVCFVISPIGDDGSAERHAADTVLKHLIRLGLGDEYDVVRADGDVNPGAITPQIVAGISEADLVVADLSGANANVFYELAIAHGYEKPVVHIQVDDEHPAFDIKDMRIIRYDTTDPDKLDAARNALRKSAAYAESNPEKIQTPLTAAERFASLQHSTDPIAESNREILSQVRLLRQEVSRQLPGGTTRVRHVMSDADKKSLLSVFASLHARNVLAEADLAGVITAATSLSFDKFMQDLLMDYFDVDIDEASEILLSPDVEWVETDES